MKNIGGMTIAVVLGLLIFFVGIPVACAGLWGAVFVGAVVSNEDRRAETRRFEAAVASRNELPDLDDLPRIEAMFLREYEVGHHFFDFDITNRAGEALTISLLGTFMDRNGVIVALGVTQPLQLSPGETGLGTIRVDFLNLESGQYEVLENAPDDVEIASWSLATEDVLDAGGTRVLAVVVDMRN